MGSGDLPSLCPHRWSQWTKFQRRKRGRCPHRSRLCLRSGHLPHALHPWRCGWILPDGFCKVLGTATKNGHPVRPAHLSKEGALFPTQRISGHRKLYLDGPDLGIHESQKIQSVKGLYKLNILFFFSSSAHPLLGRSRNRIQKRGLG